MAFSDTVKFCFGDFYFDVVHLVAYIIRDSFSADVPAELSTRVLIWLFVDVFLWSARSTPGDKVVSTMLFHNGACSNYFMYTLRNEQGVEKLNKPVYFFSLLNKIYFITIVQKYILIQKHFAVGKRAVMMEGIPSNKMCSLVFS